LAVFFNPGLLRQAHRAFFFVSLSIVALFAVPWGMTSRNIKIIARGEVICTAETLEPFPLGAGEVLIRNEASLISSGTELSRVYGLKKGVTYPVYPGYASIGRVEDFAPSPAFPFLAKGVRVLFSGAHRELQVYAAPVMNSLGMLVQLGDGFDWRLQVDRAGNRTKPL
jgi:hypothetical protein